MTARLSQPRPRAAGGFTLVELLISISMVLVLLIGINQIFKMSSDTVGSGMAISAVMRDLRGARQVLDTDLANATPLSRAPFIIISNVTKPAFMNKQDLAQDRDGNVLTPNVGNSDANVQGTQSFSASGHNYWLQANNRIHRLDVLQIFTSGNFQRRLGTMAGSNSPYQGDLTATDAWIWYGHLRLPTDTDTAIGYVAGTGFLYPGQGNATSNPNNFFASQFILGRVQVLMSQKDGTGAVLDPNKQNQWFADNNNLAVNQTTMLPLAYSSPVNVLGATAKTAAVPVMLGSPAKAVLIQHGLTDVAGISLASYRAQTQRQFATAALAVNAIKAMLWPGSGSAEGMYRFPGKAWLQKTAYANSSQAQTLQLESALEAPIFLRGCSQFIVEFAGDFMTQNADSGDLLAPAPDPKNPELDWNPVYGGSSGSTVVGRTIRWYGMERNVTGATDGSGNLVPEVLPVYWYLTPTNKSLKSAFQSNRRTLGTATVAAPFERLNADRGNTVTPVPATFTAPANADITTYTAAWGPNDLTGTIAVSPNVAAAPPWMIRITIRVDDPNGRLADGKTMEFIYQLPRQ